MTTTALAIPVAKRRRSVKIDHLSWSSLKSYATCPRKFSYRYIEVAPEEFTAASLAFGSGFMLPWTSFTNRELKVYRLQKLSQ